MIPAEVKKNPAVLTPRGRWDGGGNIQLYRRSTRPKGYVNLQKNIAPSGKKATCRIDVIYRPPVWIPFKEL
jgi:hypothetical protein